MNKYDEALLELEMVITDMKDIMPDYISNYDITKIRKVIYDAKEFEREVRERYYKAAYRVAEEIGRESNYAPIYRELYMSLAGLLIRNKE